ncbi:MAG: hypothetical protein AB2L22_06695 [Syntrophales bacterium]
MVTLRHGLISSCPIVSVIDKISTVGISSQCDPIRFNGRHTTLL